MFRYLGSVFLFLVKPLRTFHVRVSIGFSSRENRMISVLCARFVLPLPELFFLLSPFRCFFAAAEQRKRPPNGCVCVGLFYYFLALYSAATTSASVGITVRTVFFTVSVVVLTPCSDGLIVKDIMLATPLLCTQVSPICLAVCRRTEQCRLWLFFFVRSLHLFALVLLFFYFHHFFTTKSVTEYGWAHKVGKVWKERKPKWKTCCFCFTVYIGIGILLFYHTERGTFIARSNIEGKIHVDEL